MKSNTEDLHEQRTKQLGLLGCSVESMGPYRLTVRGEIPKNLTGTLFRNGPGLFERNGVKRSTWWMATGGG